MNKQNKIKNDVSPTMTLLKHEIFVGQAMIVLIALCIMLTTVFAQQIDIPRVELMPNMPSPYKMRNWKQVAMGYDSLVFDFAATGDHLPIIWWNTNTVNYPNHNSFGLHSYVGTFSPGTAEAINVLPSVIGASLAGIDKHDQNGSDWVLMCEEFFNRRPKENVYLNLPVTHSGGDWWYDTMSNVFFYQLYNMYPNTGDFANQFTTVADRWLAAVAAMGGNATPWRKPLMNYRGWFLETMTPNNSSVPEPEAAGAIAWLLYQVFIETGNPQYRIGAEWAMEFLNDLTANPAYELQLPYGAYLAARMNAELGTGYDIEKIVNWSFDVGSLRQWGIIVGNWGGYDCHGLVGEASGTGNYAFAMNGFEQAGALVPMVRYDDRFARAIGKWMLNIANASRLFYSKFLPDNQQDNETWVQQFDPKSYIAYEGLKRFWNGRSPYATGDAIDAGWAATNLGLYGSSHVGIFGGIIDTTNVPMILKLDVLKTDYFHDSAFPTYLYFNPYPVAKTVEINVGNGLHDVYDAASNSFLLSGVDGADSLLLPANSAVLAVIIPAGGTVSFDRDKMLIDNIVVDYQSGQPATNFPPRIKSLAAAPQTVFIDDTTMLYCTAEDRNNDSLSYSWRASAGLIFGTGANVAWKAPGLAGAYWVRCVVSDTHAEVDSAEVLFSVVDNHAPEITAITANPAIINAAETAQLNCVANDSDSDSLTYTWMANSGIISGSGANVNWTAPSLPGYYSITCAVTDSRGGLVMDSVSVTAGRLVGFYPFNGNANDVSGFGNHAAISGATPVTDRFGHPNSAYFFDGVNDFARIPNHPSLNFQEAITVNFWMAVDEFFNREAYPISHGNWENRWKVSILTNRRLRWTIKTDTTANSGIVDLDSQTQLMADSLYMVTVCYDGSRVELYLNAALNGVKSWGGRILQTNIDLSIAQHLPGNNSYDFKGILDDVQIYNRALTLQEIQALYDVTTAIEAPVSGSIPEKTNLRQNYPNPFNPSTTIRYDLHQRGKVDLKIFNVLGQKIRTLVDEQKPAGYHKVQWDGRDDAGNSIASGIYIYRLKAGKFFQSRQMLLLR